MKVLITGHKGFVGKAFAKRLARHDLTLIDIKDGNDAIDFFRRDDTKYDLVLHLAATVGGRKTIDLEPHKLFNNISLDAEMLQWSIKTRSRKIVYFSSSAAYPMEYQYKNSGIKLNENMIDLDAVKNPDPSVYGWSKLTGEQIIRYSGLDNVYIFRPFSGYSETQDLDYPFPAFIRRATLKLDPFEIWGDGNQVRDWIHIDDIIETVLATIAIDLPGVYNICSGRPMSFNDFAYILTNAVNYKPKFDYKLDAPVGVQYRVGDPIKSHLIYVPTISLEEGIYRALKNML